MTTNNPTSPREELARIIDAYGAATMDIVSLMIRGDITKDVRNEANERALQEAVNAILALSRPPVKAASPEREAVAWRWRKIGDPEWQFFSRGEYPPLSPPNGYENEPLYTNPPAGFVSVPLQPSRKLIEDLATEWGYDVEEACESYGGFLEVVSRYGAAGSDPAAYEATPPTSERAEMVAAFTSEELEEIGALRFDLAMKVYRMGAIMKAAAPAPAQQVGPPTFAEACRRAEESDEVALSMLRKADEALKAGDMTGVSLNIHAARLVLAVAPPKPPEADQFAQNAKCSEAPAVEEITEEMVERARRYLRHGNLETAEAIEMALQSIFDPPAALTTGTEGNAG